ncbi:DUF3069 domain-containing protein [Grimontia sp. S25]|uniref:DUF3069 domain-containing protein n=1 Tax=Grimontia sedimenti TaxID=2711294 RepID=A0A6M1R2I5_9GAMM|nr:DUF3069 domain-containing protein [Grimontia sedimenti]NGN96493.1 DUF3069 domain-containing protein [Grimontia sedimenti]
MSEQANQAQETVKLEDLSAELQQVIKYEQVPAELFTMLASIHEASESVVREAWDTMPASAQNILDNFEQFHALVSLSQSYAGLDFMQETQDMKFDDMDEEKTAEYKAVLLDKLLHNCVKDLVKQLKQARLKPAMKREFREIFTK